MKKASEAQKPSRRAINLTRDEKSPSINISHIRYSAYCPFDSKPPTSKYIFSQHDLTRHQRKHRISATSRFSIFDFVVQLFRPHLSFVLILKLRKIYIFHFFLVNCHNSLIEIFTTLFQKKKVEIKKTTTIKNGNIPQEKPRFNLYNKIQKKCNQKVISITQTAKKKKNPEKKKASIDYLFLQREQPFAEQVDFVVTATGKVSNMADARRAGKYL